MNKTLITSLTMVVASGLGCLAQDFRHLLTLEDGYQGLQAKWTGNDSRISYTIYILKAAAPPDPRSAVYKWSQDIIKDTWSQERVGENYLQNPVGIAWPKLADGNDKSDLFVSGSAKSANDASVFRIKYSDPEQPTVPVTLSGSSPGPIAVTETSLYYFDSAKQMLLKKAVDPDKSTPEPIVSGVLNLKGMAGYNDRLYYVDGDRIGMWKPGSGTQPQYVIQGLDHPKSIDVDRYGYLYVSISGKAAGGTSRPHISVYYPDGKWLGDVFVNGFEDDIYDICIADGTGGKDDLYVLRKDGVWLLRSVQWKVMVPNPTGIAADSKGNICVIVDLMDLGRSKTLRLFDENGKYIADPRSFGDFKMTPLRSIAAYGDTIYVGFLENANIETLKPGEIWARDEWARDVFVRGSDRSQAFTYSLATDKDGRVFAGRAIEGTRRYEKDGSGAITISGTKSDAITVNKNGRVFCIQGGELVMFDPIDNLSYKEVGRLSLGGVGWLAADDRDGGIYVLTQQNVKKYDENGNFREVLAENLKGARAIAIHGDKRYVTTDDGVWKYTPNAAGTGYDGKLILPSKK